MSYRPHGHARVSARRPEASAICDRCGFLYSHSALNWQHEWAGLKLQNLRLLVCDRCLDLPNPQLKARILPPDPTPIANARPEPFTYTGFGYDESNIMVQPPPSLALGAAADGAQMLMPDGVTVMLMPTNPGGYVPVTYLTTDGGSILTTDSGMPIVTE